MRFILGWKGDFLCGQFSRLTVCKIVGPFQSYARFVSIVILSVSALIQLTRMLLKDPMSLFGAIHALALGQAKVARAGYRSDL